MPSSRSAPTSATASTGSVRLTKSLSPKAAPCRTGGNDCTALPTWTEVGRARKPNRARGWVAAAAAAEGAEGAGVEVAGVADSNRQPRTANPEQSPLAKRPVPKAAPVFGGE